VSRYFSHTGAGRSIGSAVCLAPRAAWNRFILPGAEARLDLANTAGLELPAMRLPGPALVLCCALPFVTAAGSFPARVAGGSRLEVLYGQTSEGEKFYLWAYHDTKLGVPCSFRKAEDGVTRCLPQPPVLAVRHYQDASCRQLLFPAEPTCARALAVQGGAVYRLGPATRPKVVYTKVGGRCVPDGEAKGRAFFAPKEKVAPRTFVAAEAGRVVPGPGKRIAGWGRTAEDGSQERTGFWDTKYDQGCSIGTAKDGEERCLPDRTMGYPQTYFADAGCTQALAVAAKNAARAPTFVQAVDQQGCPSKSIFYSTTPRPDLQTAFRRDAAGCRPTPVPGGGTFHALGAEVPATAFERFAKTFEGAGRLQRLVLTSAEGTVDRKSDPFDRTFGDRCELWNMPDGTLRCVPYPTGQYDLFADASCRKPANRRARSVSCSRDLPAHATVLGGPWCAPIAQVYRLGDRQVRTHRRTAEGRCVPDPLDGYYERGAPLPPKTFAAAKEIRE
jgi:hypothetical protein